MYLTLLFNCRINPTEMLRFFILFSLFLHSCVAAPKTPAAAAAVPAKKWLTLNGRSHSTLHVFFSLWYNI